MAPNQKYLNKSLFIKFDRLAVSFCMSLNTEELILKLNLLRLAQDFLHFRFVFYQQQKPGKPPPTS